MNSELSEDEDVLRYSLTYGSCIQVDVPETSGETLGPWFENLPTRESGLRGLYWANVLCGLLLLIFCLPTFMLIAVLHKLTSFEPLLDCKKQVSRGKVVEIFRFRTTYQAQPSRFTPVGRILHLTRLNELLIVLNMISGEVLLSPFSQTSEALSPPVYETLSPPVYEALPPPVYDEQHVAA